MLLRPHSLFIASTTYATTWATHAPLLVQWQIVTKQDCKQKSTFLFLLVRDEYSSKKRNFAEKKLYGNKKIKISGSQE